MARAASELSLRPQQVRATAGLLAEGATVPFIARYRKEATGLLDEVAVAAIRDRLAQLAALDQRRLAILTSLQERNLLTAELRARLEGAATLTALEDLYLPFRPKRRTRAMIARERGLEPLARALMRQHPATDPQREALRYVTPAPPAGGADLSVSDPAAALQGARDIIAEWASEDAWARGRIRRLFATRGTLRSEVLTGKEAEGS
ncbi:MAG TPA: Tex-like N-terminal domain-containing protein, partial [Chloroflexota bacterium]|nr:Tex-like N-terminal domain-containing protein [Chloroflexota bacterium]